ncbi:MAG: stage V sporulation protein AD [Bacilli bacterium]|nr:stage V sporulation protein AD [Bacilli bacterium]
MTSKYNNVYISDNFTIAGIYEKDGPISDYFDLVYDKDFYYGCQTFEKAEEKMLANSIEKLISRAKILDSDIDYIVSGDLENQIAASNYAMRDFNIPFLGIYNACATFGEGVVIGANFIEGKRANKIIVSTSSHNMVAERQFRNPTEYGAPKKKTTTFTATGAVSMLLTSKKSKIKVTSTTAGMVQDKNITDVNNMGAVMAIAAADTIKRHLKDLNIKPDYYDLILTGDLGIYGKEILLEYLKEDNIDISKNYNDCGLILYDREKQPVFAGASGPVCSALVTCAYILKEMERGRYRKVLIVPTGAIFSPTRTFQKDSIPSIAHAFSLEVSD